MQVFKATLKLIIRSPLYLLLYIGFFGIIGVVIVASSIGSLGASNSAVREDARPQVAVIDRDHSEVSASIVAYLAERTTPVAIEDTTLALQNATATNQACYIAIIPEGFGEHFISAAREDAPAPLLDTVISFAESDGYFMDMITNEYLGALRLAAIGMPDAGVTKLVENATETASLRVETSSVQVEEAAGADPRTTLYFLWIGYPITLGLMVLTGSIFTVFQTGELRRRNLCSPLSSARMNTQVALGCISLVVLTWVYLIALSFLPLCGGLELLATDPLSFILLALAALVYALVPFSIGFLLSQFGMKEMAINGAANIVGLAFCFLSGIFMGGNSFANQSFETIARFTPTYWYAQAVQSMGANAAGTETLASFWSSVGIILLFALAFFSIALLIGRLRAQSAQAGGNPAAEAVM